MVPERCPSTTIKSILSPSFVCFIAFDKRLPIHFRTTPALGIIALFCQTVGSTGRPEQFPIPANGGATGSGDAIHEK